MLKWISHNQGTFVSLLICTVLVFWTYGCQSTVMSPISNKQVTRSVLTLEVNTQVKRMELELDNLLEQSKLQFLSLDRDDEIKRKLYQFAALTAQSGAFNPLGLITLAGSILGAGILVDNRVKDKVIKNRPLNGVIPIAEKT